MLSCCLFQFVFDHTLSLLRIIDFLFRVILIIFSLRIFSLSIYLRLRCYSHTLDLDWVRLLGCVPFDDIPWAWGYESDFLIGKRMVMVCGTHAGDGALGRRPNPSLKPQPQHNRCSRIHPRDAHKRLPHRQRQRFGSILTPSPHLRHIGTPSKHDPDWGACNGSGRWCQ